MFDPVETLEPDPRSAAPVSRMLLTAFALAVPLDNVALPGSTSITFAFGGAIVLAGVWQVLSARALRRPRPPILLLTAYISWAALSLLWAYDIAPSAGRFLTGVELLVFVWMAWQVTVTHQDARWLMAGYVLGCCLVAGMTWESFLSGRALIFDPDHPAYAEQRFVAMGYDPNDMGVTLALSIPMAAYLALSGAGKWSRLWALQFPLAVSAIALSGSRGATLASVIGVATVLLWIGRRSRLAVVGAGAMLAVGGVLVWILSPETWERILTTRQQLEGGTIGLRLPIWRAGLHVLVQHPLVGVGIGGFPDAVAPGLGYAIVAHNSFLSVWTELGIVGFALFFGAFVAMVVGVRRKAAAERELIVSLVLTWLVGASSLTYEFRKPTWLLLLLGTTFGALKRSPEPGHAPAAQAELGDEAVEPAAR